VRPYLPDPERTLAEIAAYHATVFRGEAVKDGHMVRFVTDGDGGSYYRSSGKWWYLPNNGDPQRVREITT